MQTRILWGLILALFHKLFPSYVKRNLKKENGKKEEKKEKKNMTIFTTRQQSENDSKRHTR